MHLAFNPPIDANTNLRAGKERGDLLLLSVLSSKSRAPAHLP
jgi:hypothetical protein